MSHTKAAKWIKRIPERRGDLVDAGCKGVLQAMWDHVGWDIERNTIGRECWPSAETLADEIGSTRSAVLDRQRKLAAAGWIMRDGRGWALAWEAPFDVVRPQSQVERDSSRMGVRLESRESATPVAAECDSSHTNPSSNQVLSTPENQSMSPKRDPLTESPADADHDRTHEHHDDHADPHRLRDPSPRSEHGPALGEPQPGSQPVRAGTGRGGARGERARPRRGEPDRRLADSVCVRPAELERGDHGDGVGDGDSRDHAASPTATGPNLVGSSGGDHRAVEPLTLVPLLIVDPVRDVAAELLAEHDRHRRAALEAHGMRSTALRREGSKAEAKTLRLIRERLAEHDEHTCRHVLEVLAADWLRDDSQLRPRDWTCEDAIWSTNFDRHRVREIGSTFGGKRIEVQTAKSKPIERFVDSAVWVPPPGTPAQPKREPRIAVPKPREPSPHEKDWE
jgi:hypothetical protein